MLQNNYLLIFIMHEDPLLTQPRIIASMANELNNRGPVVIALYNDMQYDIKRLPIGFKFREQYIDKSISLEELMLIVELIRCSERIKRISLCCHSNLGNAEVNHVTFQAHDAIARLKPNHLMLISSSGMECFTNSTRYTAGVPTNDNYILPLEVKAAVVFTRMNLIKKIKEEQEAPTWINSRRIPYFFSACFSCFFSPKKVSVGIDPLDDDPSADEHLFNISEHPDNLSQNTKPIALLSFSAFRTP